MSNWFLSLILAAATPAAAPVTVLKAARLYDGKSATAVPNAVVIVEGEKILALGSGLAEPAGATVIELGDATLLAGQVYRNDAR